MTIQDPERVGRGIDADPLEKISVVDESSIEQAEVAGLSQSQIVRRRFVRHKGAMAGMIMLMLIVVLSVTSVGVGPIPGWWKWNDTDVVPSEQGTGAPTLSLRPTWLGGDGIHLGDHRDLHA